MVEDQARTDAVTQAVSHAQSMAAAAGEKLGPVCSVTDDSAVQPYYPEPDDNASYGSPSDSEDTASAGLTAGDRSGHSRLRPQTDLIGRIS